MWLISHIRLTPRCRIQVNPVDVLAALALLSCRWNAERASSSPLEFARDESASASTSAHGARVAYSPQASRFSTAGWYFAKVTAQRSYALAFRGALARHVHLG